MPSIKDAIGADLSKYEPASPAQVVRQMINDNRPKANPAIRCPLPSFGADPDSLRQFEIGTQMPQIRVIPLPQQNGVTVPTAATAAATSSAANIIASSTSSSSAVTLTARSVPLSTGVLLAGTSFLGAATMAKSFQLISLLADSQCEVRLYGTAAAQAFDNLRATDAPASAEITSNVISCVSLDTLPYSWPWQDRTGVNQDTPQGTTIYVSIYNTAIVDVTNINVSITFLPLES